LRGTIGKSLALLDWPDSGAFDVGTRPVAAANKIDQTA
jgi:hypothetical protein